ncbi:hypothetical protein L7A47_35285, partial [Achromobacter xylosoxidans]|uniref:hypothetical protein n=1 Tax=Alcaligenes xylosoxydans xylosoxydans TaxID=85698 RepID=UPI001F0FB9F8
SKNWANSLPSRIKALPNWSNTKKPPFCPDKQQGRLKDFRRPFFNPVHLCAFTQKSASHP